MSIRWFLLSLLIISLSGLNFAQGRYRLPETSCNGIAQIWLSNVDITSLRIAKIPVKPEIKDTFSAKKNLNVYVNIFWRDTEKQHVVMLEYITPSGYLYEKKKVPVSIDGNGPVRMQLPGYRFPVKVKRAKTSADSRFYLRRTKITSIPFPVGGTYVSKNSLYGKWTLRIYIDGQDKPCAVLNFTMKG